MGLLFRVLVYSETAGRSERGTRPSAPPTRTSQVPPCSTAGPWHSLLSRSWQTLGAGLGPGHCHREPGSVNRALAPPLPRGRYPGNRARPGLRPSGSPTPPRLGPPAAAAGGQTPHTAGVVALGNGNPIQQSPSLSVAGSSLASFGLEAGGRIQKSGPNGFTTSLL
jgi:hypothetical protein